MWSNTSCCSYSDEEPLEAQVVLEPTWFGTLPKLLRVQLATGLREAAAADAQAELWLSTAGDNRSNTSAAVSLRRLEEVSNTSLLELTVPGLNSTVVVVLELVPYVYSVQFAADADALEGFFTRTFGFRTYLFGKDTASMNASLIETRRRLTSDFNASASNTTTLFLVIDPSEIVNSTESSAETTVSAAGTTMQPQTTTPPNTDTGPTAEENFQAVSVQVQIAFRLCQYYDANGTEIVDTAVYYDTSSYFCLY